MEAERKHLTGRVDYATISVRITESATASASNSLANAAREGFRNLLGGLNGIAEAALTAGPSILFWGALLFFPARWVWRRLKP